MQAPVGHAEEIQLLLAQFLFDSLLDRQAELPMFGNELMAIAGFVPDEFVQNLFGFNNGRICAGASKNEPLSRHIKQRVQKEGSLLRPDMLKHVKANDNIVPLRNSRERIRRCKNEFGNVAQANIRYGDIPAWQEVRKASHVAFFAPHHTPDVENANSRKTVFLIRVNDFKNLLNGSIALVEVERKARYQFLDWHRFTEQLDPKEWQPLKPVLKDKPQVVTA
jgi:hypothetical protein